MKFPTFLAFLGGIACCTSLRSAEAPPPPRPNILWIMADDHATASVGAYGGMLAPLNPTPELTARGYRRIGLVLDESAVIASPESIEMGFEQVQRRSADVPDFVPALCFTSQMSEIRIAEWLGQYQPDAIISGHFSLLRVLQSMNVSIPHRCAYVNLHADEEVPGVSGISQLSLALGAVAVDNLHQKLIANICGSRSFTLACQVSGCWQEGWSLDQSVRVKHRSSRILCA